MQTSRFPLQRTDKNPQILGTSVFSPPSQIRFSHSDFIADPIYRSTGSCSLVAAARGRDRNSLRALGPAEPGAGALRQGARNLDSEQIHAQARR